jgi:hypothetical protein
LKSSWPAAGLSKRIVADTEIHDFSVVQYSILDNFNNTVTIAGLLSVATLVFFVRAFKYAYCIVFADDDLHAAVHLKV